VRSTIMKRATSPQGPSPKRPKPDLHLDEDSYFNSHRTATYLLQNGVDDTGYLSGKFFMTWKPVRNILRTILEVPEGESSRRHRFEVEFTGVCADFFNKLDFKPQDDVRLALKGARLEKIVHPSRSCNLPVKLRYTEGVIASFGKRRADAAQMVNTWECESSFISCLILIRSLFQ
jgi:hypothetical protein